MIVYKVVSEIENFIGYYIDSPFGLYYTCDDGWGWTKSVYDNLSELYRIESNSNNPVEQIPLNDCEQNLQEQVYEFLLSR